MGFEEESYSVWVPELVTVIQSSDVLVDELAQGELENGESYKLSEKQISGAVDKEYTVEDFAFLKGTTHIDNGNGLEYLVIDIRKHRSRKGYQIVIDRQCLVWEKPTQSTRSTQRQ